MGCHRCRVPWVPGCLWVPGCFGARVPLGARVLWVPGCLRVPGCFGCQGCHGAMGARVLLEGRWGEATDLESSMEATDVKGLFAEVKKRMDGQIEHVRRELGGVRTGRASVTILDSVHVEAYGSQMPLNQVASLSIPEPTMIVAQPFDPSLMGIIEKAIRSANLGLNPTNDGKVVRVPIPTLTEERRKELSKLVHKYTEEGRNGVRQARRQRSPQEAPERPQDLRRRRAPRARRCAEDDRSTHRDARRSAEEERHGAAEQVARRIADCRQPPPRCPI
jgi:ribosome recycling factor